MSYTLGALSTSEITSVPPVPWWGWLAQSLWSKVLSISLKISGYFFHCLLSFSAFQRSSNSVLHFSMWPTLHRHWMSQARAWQRISVQVGICMCMCLCGHVCLCTCAFHTMCVPIWGGRQDRKFGHMLDYIRKMTGPTKKNSLFCGINVIFWGEVWREGRGAAGGWIHICNCTGRLGCEDNWSLSRPSDLSLQKGKNATPVPRLPPSPLLWCPSKVGPLGAGFSVLPPGRLTKAKRARWGCWQRCCWSSSFSSHFPSASAFGGGSAWSWWG